MARRTKRVLLCGDLHSGHGVGLTPPQYQFPLHRVDPRDKTAEARTERARNLLARVQRESWGWWTKHMHQHGPFDIAIVNGDAIDGDGKKSGGTEQITTDRSDQVSMAVTALKKSKASQYVMTFGTAYHTGDQEDYELGVANSLGAEIGSHIWPKINGLVFDCKHHLGSSSVPHGRHTAIARDKLWNQLWADRNRQPLGDILVRSHVHYHDFCGGPGWLAMTLPALQAAGTKYGTRRCSGLVDYGFVVVEITPAGSYTWQSVLAELKSETPQTINL